MTSVTDHTMKIRCWRCRLPSLSPSCLMRLTRMKWRPKLTMAAIRSSSICRWPPQQATAGKDTLRPDMSSDEIDRIIRDAYNKVPYAVGLNNHMGSAMTSSLYGMLKVMQALERYNLYFLDSMTIGNSRAMRAAQGTGVKVIKRKVFWTTPRTKRISACSSTARYSWRAVTVRRLPLGIRIRLPFAFCSKCCRTYPPISRWCVRAICSMNLRWILLVRVARNHPQRSRAIHSAA